MKKILGINLKRLRKAKGVKQIELTTALNIAPSSYSEAENGKSWPQYSTLEDIAHFHGVDISELFKAEESESIQSLSKIINKQEVRISELEGDSELDDDLRKFQKLKKIEPKQYQSMLFLTSRLIDEYIEPESDDEKERA